MKPRRLVASLGCLLFLAVSACASDTGAGPGGVAGGAAGGKADGRSEPATLQLTAGYEEILTGRIVAGAPLVVRYDLARIQECRGSTHGSDVWGITGFYGVDGDEAVAFPVTELVDGVTTAVDATIDVPAGSDLALWFQASNRWGCVAYDSDFGGNYHFAIDAAAPREVTLDFPADGSFSKSGDVVGGSDVVVRYDLSRLTSCRGTSRGYPQWSITGFYAVDGDEPRSFDVSRTEGSDRVAVDATIRVRAGRSLALWFQNVNRWGCVAWDSQDGANYVIPIEP